MEPVKPYRYLHRPYRILWLETEELALCLMGLVLGLVISVYLLFIFFFAAWVVRKTKKNKPRGFLKHIFYHFGFVEFKGLPSSNSQIFFG